MTNPDDDLLVTSEGVDEGSAASGAEDAGSGGAPRAGARTAPPAAPAEAPVDTDSAESRRARTRSGTGQQLEAGEG
ncbi:MAG: hypothetical protein WD794_05715 [Mycobacteriales bacterium]